VIMMLAMTTGKGDDEHDNDDEHDIDDEYDNYVVYNKEEEEDAM
jgi:hypothetical protein